MGITAASMLNKFKANRPAPPANRTDAAAAQGYSDALLTALFQAICDDIHQNMAVQSSGVDPQGGTVSSNSTLIS